MSELHDFFSASVGSAAALMGLLFVAITFAPERIIGDQAAPSTRRQAAGAFTALSNVFFVSLVALLPHHATSAIVPIALLSLFQSLRSGYAQFRSTSHGRWYVMASIGAGIYIVECAEAARAAVFAADPGPLAYVTIGLFAYALGSAWDLIGGKHTYSVRP